jgi:hypothetical protein
MIGSTLTLLKAGVLFVDDVQFAFATNDFAIDAALLDGGSYFHNLFLCAFGLNYLYRKLIRPRVKSYGDNSTPTLSPGRIRM